MTSFYPKIGLILLIMLGMLSCNIFNNPPTQISVEKQKSISEKTVANQNQISMSKVQQLSLSTSSLPQTNRPIIILASQDSAKEVENLCNIIHNNISPNVTVIRPQSQQIPNSILPSEIDTYIKLANAASDAVLNVSLSYKSVNDPALPDSKWIYAIADVECKDSLDHKILWRDKFSSSQGVLAWKGENLAKQEAVQILAKDISGTISTILQQIPSHSKDQIRLIINTYTPEVLKLWQNELLRLEKAKHFSIVGNILAMSCTISALLQYKGNMLSLKSLFEENLKSLALPGQVTLGDKIVNIEINK